MQNNRPAPPNEPDLLYGVRAIAEHLGMTEKAAEARIEAGDLPTFKMGKRVCATKSGLADFFSVEMGGWPRPLAAAAQRSDADKAGEADHAA